MTDLKFTATHEWLLVDGENATIGITEHAQELLGDMVYIEFPKEGREVSAQAELGVVESVKAASDFYAPVSGKVIAVNQKAEEDPALVNRDPYGAGWLVKIKMKNKEEIADLLTEKAYEALIAEDQ